jgi:two-component system sensor histidine kinase HydH
MHHTLRISITALFLATAALHAAALLLPEQSVSAQVLLGRLQLLPVMAAAWLGGWRVGLAFGLVAAASVALMRFPTDLGDFAPWGNMALDIAAGALTGLFSDRQRQQNLEPQRLAEQLRIAHAELQENFEGMKRAERLFAVGQLSAGLAHEIRNPLASISGAAGILRRSAVSNEKREEVLEIIEKESQRLNAMLTSFLDFARPRPPQPRLIRVSAVLHRVIGLASHSLGKRQIDLRLHVEDADPEVMVDDEQLQQVLLNMLMNAIQASEDGDVVLLATRIESGKLWVDVRDQGSGVKPEHVDRLFDPFFTTKEHGTGLGLPVAHEIVRSIGGMLKVSHNADRGMTFSVGLPLPRHEQDEHQTDPAG